MPFFCFLGSDSTDFFENCRSRLSPKTVRSIDLETWIKENQLPLKPAIRIGLRRRLNKL
jgi:hypothetical protein